jgi:RNA polymerase sigma-70 factor (ECF subfamily)
MGQTQAFDRVAIETAGQCPAVEDLKRQLQAATESSSGAVVCLPHHLASNVESGVIFKRDSDPERVVWQRLDLTGALIGQEPATLMSIDESRLVQELKRGNNLEESYRDLFNQYYRPLVYFFGNRGFTREESRELAQETFLKVFRGIRRFRQESSLKVWILRIATNLSSNKIRERRSVKRFQPTVSIEEFGADELPVLDNASCSGSNPERSYLARESEQRLRQAILGLPPGMRSCIMLHVYHGYRYREISVILKISIQTVKSHISQAKQKLKAKLDIDIDTSTDEGDEDG